MAKEIYVSSVDIQTKSMLMVWSSLLWISDLPDILFYYLIGPVPVWLIYIKFSIMLMYTGVCLTKNQYKPILPYAISMLVFIGGVMTFDWIRIQAWWKAWFPLVESSFLWISPNIFVRDFALIILMIAAMWFMKRKRTTFSLRMENGKPRLNL